MLVIHLKSASSNHTLLITSCVENNIDLFCVFKKGSACFRRLNTVVTMNANLWRIHIGLLKSVGLWPSNQNGVSRLLLKTLFWVHFLLTAVLFIFQELLYMFFYSQDFLELLKTIAATSYHVVCLLTMIQWLFLCSSAQEILTVLNRNKFKEFCERYCSRWFLEEVFSKAKFMSLTALSVFVSSAFLSLTSSYVSVWIFPEECFDIRTNEMKIYRTRPYYSYTFFNLNETGGFLMDTFFQWYTIFYLTIGFLCKCYVTVLLHFMCGF